MATAPIRPLAWEPPYATGAAQEIATTTTTKRQKDKNQNKQKESSSYGTAEMNPASIHENVGLIPGLAQWVGDLALP